MTEAVITIIEADGSRTALHAPKGKTLHAVLTEAGYAVEAPCGGNGTCGKCEVAAEGALSAATPEEQGLPSGRRLACRARVEGDCTVRLDEGKRSAGYAVLTEGAAAAFPFRPWAAGGLGAAVDIGTTTVVVYLYDLDTGARLAVRGAANRQRSCGADVISRISYSMTEPDGLLRLTGFIRSQLRDLFAAAAADAGRSAAEIRAVTVAGNTVMAHLFTGLSPARLSKLPFTPESLFGEGFAADFGAELGLAEDAEMLIVPAVSGYVGGDIVAAALAAGLDRAGAPVLLLDIGTNGEMALAAGGRIFCCATAAGPAFEGAGIACGMGGTDGAMARAALQNGALACEVIGGGKARGICGSGLIDLLAAMLDLGAVDETGRLLPPDEAPEAALPYIREQEDGEAAFYVAEDVFVSGRDVRQLQLAKAAIAGGIATLLDEAGLGAEAVTTLYLAGGFGNKIDPVNAGKIGLYPAELAARAVSVGNGAGAGAAAALCSAEARAALTRLRDRMEYIELSADPRFMDHYVEQMMF